MYEIEFKETVHKDLAKIPQANKEIILRNIIALKANPRPKHCRKLKGMANSYRLKIGHYRVIYEIFDKTLLILVVAAGHRKDIYK
ncbi:MAG: type II toxin-antitoxin system RelE/ParE family toxin [Ignavibacteriaceae bacterium]|nr:type II toxin-antitoxin system RelE/ParE family toxin [Ignavibacteriaceae bacterium]